MKTKTIGIYFPIINNFYLYLFLADRHNQEAIAAKPAAAPAAAAGSAGPIQDVFNQLEGKTRVFCGTYTIGTFLVYI